MTGHTVLQGDIHGREAKANKRPDRMRLNIQQKADFQYRTRALNVETVGPDVEAVEAYLRNGE